MERCMLLDEYLPQFDVRIRCATRIVASSATVYASLWTTNFDHWGVTRSLYAVRTLPSFPSRPVKTWHRFYDQLFRRRFTLDQMLLEGFALLDERRGEELVLGTIGRFWRARGELRAPNPVQFRAPAPAGTAKAAWSFEVGAQANGATELKTETRVLCADAATRRRFCAYWILIKPFSGLIRQEMLAAVRSTAEFGRNRVADVR